MAHLIPSLGLDQDQLRFRAILNCIEKVAVQGFRADGTVTFWNQASEELFGLAPDEILGEDIIECHHTPETREEERRLMAEAIQTGVLPPSGEVEIKRKDGTTRWVYSSVALISWPDEEPEFFCFDIDITERKRAEQALRKSEERYRSIVETTTEWIWEMDQSRRHTFTNPAMTAIIGYRPEEIVDQDALSLLHPEDRPDVEAKLPRLMAEKSGWRGWVLRWRHKDGSYRYLESNASPLIDETGELVGYVGADRDITDRKRAEEVLRQSRIELQCVLDTAADGILAIDSNGKVIKANQRFVDMWHIPKHLIDAGNDKELLDFVLDQLSEPEAFLKKVQALYKSSEEDVDTLSFKDGRVYERNSSPMLSGGAIIGRVWSFHDVTDRVRAENALRDSEARWQFALEGPGDGVWDWNVMTDYVYYSPQWKAMLGYAEDEIGDTLDEWASRVHPDDKPAVYADLQRHFRHETDVYQNEHRVRCKDGAYKWILDRGKVCEWTDDGKPLRVIGTHTDISRRKFAEAERDRLEAQLRQAQKMEAVGQLAGGIAHDFNNMLQVILGNLDLVAGEFPSDTSEGEALAAVRTAALRATALTKQLLAFSRRQIIQPICLELNDLIEGVLKMVRRVIGEHIELRYMPGEHLSIVCADRGQIEQVLMNLCVNARDAMPTGGTLTIKTENVAFDTAYCRDNLWAAPGNYVLLSVMDTGCGMDEATLKQIFEPFFTTKQVGQGTGLGLPSVYGIVKQHNGLIHVSSKRGEGTTFNVYLPVAEQEPEVLSPQIEPPVEGGTETILVAEDDEAVRTLVERMLKAAGYTVLTAADGEEALRVFETNADLIDMAILDVMMPGLGGRDVMDHMQAKSPRLRFLFSSGYSEDAIHSSFIIKEGFRLITKPYGRIKLLRTVREILDEPRQP